MASRFPSKIYWIATERGHRFLPNEQQENILNIQEWDKLSSIPLKGIKTLVIDTISGLYEPCFQDTCKKNNWKHPSDAGAFGPGWSEIRRTFSDGMKKLIGRAAIAKTTTIMIDHTKEQEVETESLKFSKLGLGMSGQAREIITKIPDYIWFLGYGDKGVEADDMSLHRTTSKRALYVIGDNTLEAGTRDPNVAVKCIAPLSKNKPYEQICQNLYGNKETA